MNKAQKLIRVQKLTPRISIFGEGEWRWEVVVGS